MSGVPFTGIGGDVAQGLLGGARFGLAMDEEARRREENSTAFKVQQIQATHQALQSLEAAKYQKTMESIETAPFSPETKMAMKRALTFQYMTGRPEPQGDTFHRSLTEAMNAGAIAPPDVPGLLSDRVHRMAQGPVPHANTPFLQGPNSPLTDDEKRQQALVQGGLAPRAAAVTQGPLARKRADLTELFGGDQAKADAILQAQQERGARDPYDTPSNDVAVSNAEKMYREAKSKWENLDRASGGGEDKARDNAAKAMNQARARAAAALELWHGKSRPGRGPGASSAAPAGGLTPAAMQAALARAKAEIPNATEDDIIARAKQYLGAQ